MTTDHKATIEAVNAAFSSNDIGAFLDLCTDDIEMGIVGQPVSKGKDALAREMGSASRNPPVIHVTDILVSGDKGVCDGLMEMSDTNGDVRHYGYADCYTFRDGKVSSIRVYIHEIKKGRDLQD